MARLFELKDQMLAWSLDVNEEIVLIARVEEYRRASMHDGTFMTRWLQSFYGLGLPVHEDDIERLSDYFERCGILAFSLRETDVSQYARHGSREDRAKHRCEARASLAKLTERAEYDRVIAAAQKRIDWADPAHLTFEEYRKRRDVGNHISAQIYGSDDMVPQHFAALASLKDRVSVGKMADMPTAAGQGTAGQGADERMAATVDPAGIEVLPSMELPSALKECSRCRADLPLECFNKHNQRPDGLQAWCRDCTNSYHRERSRTVKGETAGASAGQPAAPVQDPRVSHGQVGAAPAPSHDAAPITAVPVAPAVALTSERAIILLRATAKPEIQTRILQRLDETILFALLEHPDTPADICETLVERFLLVL